jgi:hypothetical protein
MIDTNPDQPALASLQAQRLARWGQTSATRLADSGAAAKFIERVGIASLFPASPEIPNLYHAYVGDPQAKAESEWDSPAGEVYGWRWELGRPQAAFYTAIVRRRPTWVSWALLPAILRLCGDLRTPDEIYEAGELSTGAQRIARALSEAGGVLSTGELRQLAGFPTGKPQRTAYLKAVEELDTRLLLAKVFATDGDEMSHALVRSRYPKHVAIAEQMAQEEAIDQFLKTYLPQAVYAVPTVLAKHLRLAETELRAGLERLVVTKRARPIKLAGQKGDCYVLI